MRLCIAAETEEERGSVSSFDGLVLTRSYEFCYRRDVDHHTIAVGTEGRYLVVLMEVVGLDRFGGGVLVVA